jgi:hypothetical protein
MDILQTTHLQKPLRSEVVGHYERFKDRLVASFEGPRSFRSTCRRG